jgi:hypothetical protein
VTKPRITKEETKQLIEHALSSSETMNGTKLAKFIGEPDSRISNAKSCEWSMTKEQAILLIEKFGQPRRKPGVFVRCETATSITSFIENEIELSKLRHWEKIINYVSSTKTQEKLVEILSKDPTYIPVRDMDGNLIDEPVKQDAKAIFNKFNIFMESDEFKSWLQSARKWLQRAIDMDLSYDKIRNGLVSLTSYNIDKLDDIPVPIPSRCELPYDASLQVFAKNNGLRLDSGMTAVDLILFGSFYYEINSNGIAKDLSLPKSYAFGDKNCNFIASELTNYVITGKVVWQEQGSFTQIKKGQPASNSIAYKVPDEALIFSPTIHERIDSNNIADDWQVDCWTTYLVKLYIHENCDYSLLIELGSEWPRNQHSQSDHLCARQIIIPKIPGLQLFDHLGTLRAWLELEELPEIEIKKNIAKAGGFIPGAIIL